MRNGVLSGRSKPNRCQVKQRATQHLEQQRKENGGWKLKYFEYRSGKKWSAKFGSILIRHLCVNPMQVTLSSTSVVPTAPASPLVFVFNRRARLVVFEKYLASMSNVPLFKKKILEKCSLCQQRQQQPAAPSQIQHLESNAN